MLYFSIISSVIDFQSTLVITLQITVWLHLLENVRKPGKVYDVFYMSLILYVILILHVILRFVIQERRDHNLLLMLKSGLFLLLEVMTISQLH